jgi:hypothetical protein
MRVKSVCLPVWLSQTLPRPRGTSRRDCGRVGVSKVTIRGLGGWLLSFRAYLIILFGCTFSVAVKVYPKWRILCKVALWFNTLIVYRR